MITERLNKLAAALALMAAVGGCGSSETDDLQRWMAEQRSQTHPKVAALSEPTKFAPQPYTQEGATEPFSSQKLTQALKRDSSTTSNAALIAPELSRRKEPLEATPLDAMFMVGSLVRNGQPVALIKVDNLLYQVHAGNYLGQNFGRILKISENDITLREIVQDAAGEWIERPATLQLQEGKK